MSDIANIGNIVLLVILVVPIICQKLCWEASGRRGGYKTTQIHFPSDILQVPWQEAKSKVDGATARTKFQERTKSNINM